MGETFDNGETFEFTVQIDIHDGEDGPTAGELTLAIHRVLTHATEVDIEGAEALDQRIGQITVSHQR